MQWAIEWEWMAAVARMPHDAGGRRTPLDDPFITTPRGNFMMANQRTSLATFAAAVVLAALSACSTMSDMGHSMASAMGMGQKLTGDQEVPPVATSASGSGSIKVADDGSVSGSVKTTGMDGLAAHIHMAAAGKNGAVIVPLVKSGDGEWSVPAGAKLTAEQLAAYKAGDLYVNVHTAANKGGEIRAQLKP
jgi:hypothetical protein